MSIVKYFTMMKDIRQLDIGGGFGPKYEIMTALSATRKHCSGSQLSSIEVRLSVCPSLNLAAFVIENTLEDEVMDEAWSIGQRSSTEGPSPCLYAKCVARLKCNQFCILYCMSTTSFFPLQPSSSILIFGASLEARSICLSHSLSHRRFPRKLRPSRHPTAWLVSIVKHWLIFLLS